MLPYILYLSFIVSCLSSAESGEASLAAAAKSCVSSCQLPNCHCFHHAADNNPGELAMSDLPQIVVLTFDDAVTRVNMQFYEKIFKSGLVNPNGCQIKGTFFTSHQYCEYDKVHQLYAEGHEIASHSISHQTPADYWKTLTKTGWKEEIDGQRQILAKFAKVNSAEVVGSRAPFLQTGGNDYFQMLKDLGFLYDSSMPTREYADTGLWPYTLDYRSDQDCAIRPCPNISLPGVWVSPMNDLLDLNGRECAMYDTCTRPRSEAEAFALLKNNFDNFYLTTKAPLGLYTHAALFSANPYMLNGLLRFLKYITSKPDVYVVPMRSLIDYTRNPVKLSQHPFPCATVRRNQCTRVYRCKYTNADGSEQYMSSCAHCPPRYPAPGNPMGHAP